MTRRPAGKPILIVEDDRTLNRLIAGQCAAMGLDARSAHSWAEASALLQSYEPSLVILDIRLPDDDGRARIAELARQCPVVVLTAYGTIRQAVEAIRAGAAEYLTKPAAPEELEIAVTRALETVSLRRNYEYLRQQLRPATQKALVGRSAALRELMRMIQVVAPSDGTVLIEGESGVGKELVAAAIHQLSARADRAFVPIDCCTLQENLFESELFGHEKGAFTGADQRKPGLIEVAEGGTVFLDEIGELAPPLQAKLLRVLETGHFRRLGGTHDLSSDVRFVAATNRDLKAMAEAGQFRSDLYYRLAALVVTPPPLRARPEDIPLLAEHFLATRGFQRSAAKRLSAGALAALQAYPWPGNVRELRNVIERAILVSGAATEIEPDHLGLPQRAAAAGATTRLDFAFDHEPTMEEVERSYLARLLRQHSGRRARVAQVLGISERNLYRLIKRHGLADAPPA